MKNYFINEDGHKMIVINPDTNYCEEFELFVVKENKEIASAVDLGEIVAVAEVVQEKKGGVKQKFDAAPKKRGRQPGSKNKPKTKKVVEEEVDMGIATSMPKVREKGGLPSDLVQKYNATVVQAVLDAKNNGMADYSPQELYERGIDGAGHLTPEAVEEIYDGLAIADLFE